MHNAAIEQPMKIQGSLLKAINIAMDDHLANVRAMPNREIEPRVELFEVSTEEDRLEWKIDIAPTEAATRPVVEKHKGYIYPLNRYFITIMVRKSDYKIRIRISGQ